MSSCTPDQAQYLRDFYLRCFAQEHATYQKAVDRVPDDSLGWKPHEKSMPVDYLCWHTAGFGFAMATALHTGNFDHLMASVRPETPKTKEALTSEIKSMLAKTEELTQSATTEQLTRLIPFFNFPPAPGVEYLGWHLSHLVHHRGQLTVYLRLLGVKVPSIYGPSADEPMPGM